MQWDLLQTSQQSFVQVSATPYVTVYVNVVRAEGRWVRNAGAHKNFSDAEGDISDVLQTFSCQSPSKVFAECITLLRRYH